MAVNDPDARFLLATHDERLKIWAPPVSAVGFDTAMEHAPVLASQSRLFTMPVEVITLIAKHLADDRGALQSLALVNSDCRQLSRSLQFKSVRLDYGPNTEGLLQLLAEEGAERLANGGRAIRRSLGVCIRDITVATDPAWVAERQGINGRDRSILSLPTNERLLLLHATSQHYNGWYLPLIARSFAAMPLLRSLRWRDLVEVPPYIFRALADSTVCHVRFDHVIIPSEFVVMPPSSRPLWPLRTLEMMTRGRHWAEIPADLSPMYLSLLKLCAPTLQKLRIEQDDHVMHKAAQRRISFGDNSTLAFPSLRHLHLTRVTISRSAFKTLLDSKLQSLTVSLEMEPTLIQVLAERGNIATLELIHFYKSQGGDFSDSALSFLCQNPQLRKVCISGSLTAASLNDKLLPAVTASLTTITHLSFATCGGPETETLAQISRIRSLTSLSLAARHDHTRHWLINHAHLRSCLAPLASTLRRLALRHDTYPATAGAVSPEDYYSARIPTAADFTEARAAQGGGGAAGRPGSSGGGDGDGSEGDSTGNNDYWVATPQEQQQTAEAHFERVWEHAHRKRMLDEAARWKAALPALEWVYFGQLPMGFRGTSGGGCAAVPLARKRERHWEVLQSEFEALE